MATYIKGIPFNIINKIILNINDKYEVNNFIDSCSVLKLYYSDDENWRTLLYSNFININLCINNSHTYRDNYLDILNNKIDVSIIDIDSIDYYIFFKYTQYNNNFEILVDNFKMKESGVFYKKYFIYKS